MYTHQLYQLTACSDLYCPELISIKELNQTSKPDIEIKKGLATRDGLSEADQIGPYLYANESRLWLKVPDVATFIVEEGKRITYQPVSGIDDQSVRVFLLGSVLGALLMQRGYLVLHGNAFQVGDECVICVGHSGAGKSTLAAAMMQAGYPVISDDVCAINDQGEIIPGFPRIKLWKDTAKKLGIETQGLRKIRPNMEKFDYPLGQQFCQQRLPVKALYVLNSHNEDRFTVQAITKMDKFYAFQQHSYRRPFLVGKMAHEHIRQCGKFSKKIEMATIRRPSEGFQIDALREFIINDVEQRLAPQAASI